MSKACIYRAGFCLKARGMRGSLQAIARTQSGGTLPQPD